jgi:hypothetical protein
LDHLQLGPFRIKKKVDFDNYELELTPEDEDSSCLPHFLTPANQTKEDINATEEEYEVENPRSTS